MTRIADTAPIDTYLDLGTGTGRILKLFAPRARHAIGIDASREMLAVARANLDPARNRNVQVRHGDIYALPFPNASADFMTVHQVLHYLDEPGRALIEAGRVLKPGGHLMIVDFAPHELEELRELHAHRRLGIADDLMSGWLERAGLSLKRHDILPPPSQNGRDGLTVSIWLSANVPESASLTKLRAPAAAAE
jgi:ubiquinone/menaquinone biosynthesis C-methylase UbiE